ncbi:MAG TPA: hypothetical protein VGO80_09435 [Solirubrobacteraceae bacterium]|jgi:hypothetical protein|nr:hypothetical protein [Solirubrobacteraceae bacterium]
MARRSLRPHLNQIRGWVRQGRTDAWIAHQLEATVQQIETFKRDNELIPAEADNGDAPGVDFDDEIDLRAEDDALVAAEIEAAEARKAEEARVQAEEDARLKAEEDARRAEVGEDESDAEGDEAPARTATRRRGRRGGRGRAGAKSSTAALEGTFDHGEEGYGLWLDPAVTDNPIYAEHWAGHRPVEVTIEEDQIVIRRAGADAED